MTCQRPFIHKEFLDAASCLTASEFRLLCGLWSFAGKGEDIWPAITTVAEMAGMAERTARRSLSVLIDKGFVSTVARVPGHPNVLRLHLPPDPPAKDGTPMPDWQGGHANVAGGVCQDGRGGMPDWHTKYSREEIKGSDQEKNADQRSAEKSVDDPASVPHEECDSPVSPPDPTPLPPSPPGSGGHSLPPKIKQPPKGSAPTEFEAFLRAEALHGAPGQAWADYLSVEVADIIAPLEELGTIILDEAASRGEKFPARPRYRNRVASELRNERSEIRRAILDNAKRRVYRAEAEERSANYTPPPADSRWEANNPNPQHLSVLNNLRRIGEERRRAATTQ